MDFSQTNQNDIPSKQNAALQIVSGIGNPVPTTANMQKSLSNEDKKH